MTILLALSKIFINAYSSNAIRKMDIYTRSDIKEILRNRLWIPQGQLGTGIIQTQTIQILYARSVVNLTMMQAVADI